MKKNKFEKFLRQAITYITDNKANYVKNASDFTRNRKLPMDKVIEILLSMEGGTLQKELYKFSKLNNVDIFSSSAFVQQRSKILPQAFKDMFLCFNDLCEDKKTLKGYKVFAIDGTDVDIFRDCDSECFISSSQNPRGYCKLHINALYDVLNRTYVDAYLQPRTKSNEQLALIKLLNGREFKGKNIIITDREYEGYNVFAHLLNTKNVDFICRVKQGAGGMRDIIKLPMKELDVDISPEITITQTNEDKKNNRLFLPNINKSGKSDTKDKRPKTWDFPSPYVLNLRVVRFEIAPGIYETIVTSLGRKDFSINEIKMLYHMRWEIETSFRELKYVIGLVHLHCKKEELVVQEIFCALTMYNYCSRISCSIPIKNINSKKRVYAYKVNYKMAVYLCRTYLKLHKNNFTQLLNEICNYIEPIREGRKDERKLRSKFFLGFTYRVAA